MKENSKIPQNSLFTRNSDSKSVKAAECAMDYLQNVQWLIYVTEKLQQRSK